MFQSIQHRAKNEAAVMAIDITPLIDIVFILLIFFMVSATFTRETGIEVEKPQSVWSQSLSPQALRISIASGGAIYTQGQGVNLRQLQGIVKDFLKQNPEGPVVIIPHKTVEAARFVEVMDSAKQAGAASVAIAVQKKNPLP